MIIRDTLRHKCVHEERIFDIFEGDVFFGDREPVFDGCLAILLFSNRSGSNLLADNLIQSGIFSGLIEMLNFDFVEAVVEREGIRSFQDYIRKMAWSELNKKGDSVFGLKASSGQLLMMYRWGIHRMFNELKVINIERNDLVAQSVSMMIANQTKQWTSENIAVGKAEYDFEALHTIFHFFQRDIGLRRALLSLFKVEHITVNYQDVTERPRAVVESCCNLFGRHMPASFISQPRIRKQSTALNDDYARRFIEELKSMVVD